MKKFLYTLIVLFGLHGLVFADSKITALSEMTDVQGSDIIYIVDAPGSSPASEKITVTNLFDIIDTSAELRGILGDETGTGVAVFGTSPTITTPTLSGAITNDAGALTDNSIQNADIDWSDLSCLQTSGAAATETYGSGWNADGCPGQRNNIYDYLHQIDTDDDGSLDDESITPTRDSNKYKKWTSAPTGADLVAGRLYLASDPWNPGGLSGSPAVDHYVTYDGANWILDRDEDGNQYANSIQLPGHATSDAALSNLGEVFVDDTESAVAFHFGANGEVAGEAQISAIIHKTWCFDPKIVCDGAVDRYFLFTVGDEAPNGIIIDEWKLSFEADPTTEWGAGETLLKYADAFIGVANTATIDDLATTAGVSSEDTDANINSGSAVANSKVVYIDFPTAYTEASHRVIFEIWYHLEED